MAAVAAVLTQKLPRIPACQLCREKKIKCDSKRPQCASCTTSGADCVIGYPDGSKVVSRKYVYELEQKICDSISTPNLGNITQVDDSSSPATTFPTYSSNRGPNTPTTDLEGGGISFMTLLFSDPEWRKNNANLGFLTKVPRSGEINTAPNRLPSLHEIRDLFGKYLEGSHVQHSFVLEDDVLQLYERVTSADYHGRENTAHDLFRTFMILAIASVVPHRQGVHGKSPFGYYLAAMDNFDVNFLACGISAIQDLLFISRFGIYHHIGTSIWDTIRLCMRMCIELGLHKPPKTRLSLLDEQLRRQVFWACYVMDRYSSCTLNRPFAIADRDILVNMTASASDREIRSAADYAPDLDSFCRNRAPIEPNDMSVAIYCVRLRQITSRIQYETIKLLNMCPSPGSGKKPFLEPGRVFTVVETFSRELTEWRNSAPRFEQPRSLYERGEFYDLLEARERLLLVRKAVDLIPKRNGLPPDFILRLCLQCAVRAILLYSDLFRRSLITYTRSYFQTIFTAGLSVLFCISVSTGLKNADIREGKEALDPCEETLKQMAAQLPDASPFTAVFEGLRVSIAQKLAERSSDGRAAPKPAVARLEEPLHPPHEEPAAASGGYQQEMPIPYPNAAMATGHQNVYNGGPAFAAGTETNLGFANGFVSGDIPLGGSMNYDTLWNMGNFDYRLPSDLQDVLEGMNFHYYY